MGDACDMNQFAISKGGISCVLGTCQQSVNWASLATDFLVLSLLSNQRYSKVVCLDFEGGRIMRRLSELVTSWNKRYQNHKNARLISESWQTKMKVIDIKYSAIDNKYSITPQDNLSEASHNLDKSSTMSKFWMELRHASPLSQGWALWLLTVTLLPQRCPKM